jgi:hypothetical protein
MSNKKITSPTNGFIWDKKVRNLAKKVAAVMVEIEQ